MMYQAKIVDLVKTFIKKKKTLFLTLFSLKMYTTVFEKLGNEVFLKKILKHFS
jgi:hypothetical protein